LKAGEITEIPLKVKFSESVLPGTSMEISTILDCTPYIENKNFTISVGMTRESFENQSLTVFPWKNSVMFPWVITDKSSYDGNFSARSGIIPNNSESVLSLSVNTPVVDTVRFMVSVSSESNYDFLIFNLNKKEIFKLSGESGWIKKEVILREGFNLLEWTYRKDQNLAAGSDRAWLDFISFPVISFMKVDLKLDKITIPNPEKGYRLETVKADVINFGRDTLNGFNLAYEINDGIPVTEHFDKVIFPGDTLTAVFNKPADLSHGGTYNISAFGISNNDWFLKNDTAKIIIVNTSIEIPEEEDEDNVIIAPNPFRDNFRISHKSNTAGNIVLKIFDSIGRKIQEEERPVLPGENIISVDGAHFHPGIYTLRITGKAVSETSRIVKIK